MLDVIFGRHYPCPRQQQQHQQQRPLLSASSLLSRIVWKRLTAVILLLTALFITTAKGMTTSPSPSSPSPSSSSSPFRLDGQRILVTGAGRGIGRAIARICQEQGARVAIVSRTRTELEETASLALSTCSGSTSDKDGAAAVDTNSPAPLLLPMEVFVADLTNQEQVESMVQSVVDKMDGGIDILINNAGASQTGKGPSQTLDSDKFLDLLNVNVVAVHRVTSAVLRQGMLLPPTANHSDEQQQRAACRQIINISSRAAKIGIPNNSLYVASKFALEGLSASLAEELRDKNICVNTISPGMVDTRSFPKPAGRPGVRTPEAIRDGLLYIMESAATRGVTGHYLHVDELDEARAAKGDVDDDSVALKPIREPVFAPP